MASIANEAPLSSINMAGLPNQSSSSTTTTAINTINTASPTSSTINNNNSTNMTSSSSIPIVVTSDMQLPRRVRCYATYSVLKLMTMIAFLLIVAVHRKHAIDRTYEKETKDKCGACLRQALVSPTTLFEFGGQCSRVFPPAERMGVSNLLTTHDAFLDPLCLVKSSVKDYTLYGIVYGLSVALVTGMAVAVASLAFDVSDAAGVVAVTINLVLFATTMVVDYANSIFLLAQEHITCWTSVIPRSLLYFTGIELYVFYLLMIIEIVYRFDSHKVSLTVRCLTFLAFIGALLTSLAAAVAAWTNQGSMFHLPIVIIAMLSMIEAPVIIFGCNHCITASAQLLFRRPRRSHHGEHVPLLTKKSRRSSGHRSSASQSSMMIPTTASSVTSLSSLIIDDNYNTSADHHHHRHASSDATDSTIATMVNGNNGGTTRVSHPHRFVTSASEPALLTIQHAQQSR